ncbi:WecB/TagA/CpsF family glycosyltransferase [Shewanella electrodiphila]|uniref:WecB/TagA/CpsF family glycosyltransferase n=1 Tax=Shewanella electrodiphila TaxID=934143 RepID=A0ABT0KR36_9GAMM|nr:WecB/TagA/CpsF family glycosyltransferase [Shewanella electrodiphila]MCL1046208.1 WecB/TagA/CpsF family glycosyltransferase [Shewanella electrodiphila]
MNSSSILEKVSYIEKSKVDDFINHLINVNQPTSLGFLNQHGYNLIAKSTEIDESFRQLDYVLRDGIGIKIACKYNHISAGENLNGTDLIPSIIKQAQFIHSDINFIVYGTVEPWLSIGANKLFLGNDYQSLDGFKDDEAYLDHFKENCRDERFNIVVLAMGMPKQERVAKLLKHANSARTLIICGGAIIDFQAGRHSRAPDFYRNNGLEWLYRLSKEPKRMFSRYVVGIPIFFANVALRK